MGGRKRFEECADNLWLSMVILITAWWLSLSEDVRFAEILKPNMQLLQSPSQHSLFSDIDSAALGLLDCSPWQGSEFEDEGAISVTVWSIIDTVIWVANTPLANTARVKKTTMYLLKDFMHLLSVIMAELANIVAKVV